MFCQLTCSVVLSWLATVIAQVATATGGQGYESFDVSTGCTSSDCAAQQVGSIYEYPEYTSSPTVECTSTRTQISIITRGPEISQTLDGCATLKGDAEYSDYEYKCASGDNCMSTLDWWGCCAQAKYDSTAYDCSLITSCVEHKYLSACGQSCSEDTYVTRCTDPAKPFCVTATAVQNLADLSPGYMSFRTQTRSTGPSSRPFDATCWEAQTVVSVLERSTITLGTQSESPIGLHIACGATPYNGLRFTISAASVSGDDVNAAAIPDGVNPAVLIDTANFAGTAPSGVAINPVAFTGCGLEQDCASSTQAAENGANVFDVETGTESDDSSADEALKSLAAGSDQDASNATTHMFPDLFTGIVARATGGSSPASDSRGSSLSFPTTTQSNGNQPTTTSGARKMAALPGQVFLSVGLGLMWTMIADF